eukprot:m.126285 g.126285  ORF g.126285 m.126285 type:complete len:158 (+) comp16675_c2_seq1:174-647(+)
MAATVDWSKATCCLLDNGKRCQRPASSATFSKRAKRAVSAKKLSMAASDSVDHNYLCQTHKERVAAAVSSFTKSDRRKKRDEDAEDYEVNFNQLHMNTLKRYKKHYKLNKDASSKPDLVEAISTHFAQQDVIEMDTILLFTHMIKSNTNRFDKADMD